MSPVFGHGRLRLYLLKLLDESPRHGYDVIRELEDRFMGLYTPSAGTVYPRLARLEADGKLGLLCCRLHHRPHHLLTFPKIHQDLPAYPKQ